MSRKVSRFENESKEQLCNIQKNAMRELIREYEDDRIIPTDLLHTVSILTDKLSEAIRWIEILEEKLDEKETKEAETDPDIAAF